jgi:hypothetical protein
MARRIKPNIRPSASANRSAQRRNGRHRPVVCPRPAVHEHQRVAVPDDFDEEDTSRIDMVVMAYPSSD